MVLTRRCQARRYGGATARDIRSFVRPSTDADLLTLAGDAGGSSGGGGGFDCRSYMAAVALAAGGGGSGRAEGLFPICPQEMDRGGRGGAVL